VVVVALLDPGLRSVILSGFEYVERELSRSQRDQRN
jgi:hypothetical protein